MDRPTLYLICGLPGSGKTTRAKALEVERRALRLNADEWIVQLYGPDLDRPQRDAVRDPVEAVQWQVAKRVLRLGGSVILDWGFWTRAERASYRQRAAALGADAAVIFLDADLETLWARIAQRDVSQRGTLQITREELEAWATLFEPPSADELA